MGEHQWSNETEGIAETRNYDSVLSGLYSSRSEPDE
jgi:hypothetical protein